MILEFARLKYRRILGVDITGPSVPYGLDSTENWDKHGECLGAGLSWNCNKELRLLAL